MTYRLTDWTFLRAGSLFWLTAQVALVAAITTRVVYEVRQSIGSAIVFCATAVLFTATIFVDHHWFRNQFIGEVHIFFETSLMWGSLLLSIGMITFARFVYLDAHSLVKRKEQERLVVRKKSNKKRAKVESTTGKSPTGKRGNDKSAKETSRQSDSPLKSKLKKPTAATKLAGTSSRPPVPKPASEIETKRVKEKAEDRSRNPDILKLNEVDRQLLNTDDADVQMLSKSERRRLRKLQKRTRQAA